MAHYSTTTAFLARICEENISEYFPDEENAAEDLEDYQDLSEEESDTADQIEGIDSLLARSIKALLEAEDASFLVL